MTPESGVVYQAGIGGRTAYGRAGVVEFGGSAGFIRAGDLTQLSLSPSIGWFFLDNVQVSGIFSINYSNVDGESSSFYNVLAEPSFHLPFSDSIFGFVGLGFGPSYADDKFGFALVPRLGMNAMVGRSGILTPALFMQYNTHEVAQAGNSTVLGVTLAYGLNVGYTIMW